MGGQFVVIIAIALIAGAGGGLLSRLLLPANVPVKRNEPGSLRATNIALVDGLGRERAVLKLVDNRPMLVLSDEYVVPSGDKVLMARVAAGILKDGVPGVELADPNGKKRIAISVGTDGESMLELVARNGKGGLTLSVTSEGVPAVMSVDVEGKRAATWP
jgi:hypothetical protein